MKILLDEDLPHRLARRLPSYQVETVVSMSWSGIRNGALLAMIEDSSFDAFITGDKNMKNQQKLTGRPFAVLVLSAVSWKILREKLSAIEDALENSSPDRVYSVECGAFVPRRFRDDRRTSI